MFDLDVNQSKSIKNKLACTRLLKSPILHFVSLINLCTGTQSASRNTLISQILKLDSEGDKYITMLRL